MTPKYPPHTDLTAGARAARNSVKKVVINVPEGIDPGDVAFLVRDALSDFVRVRTDGDGGVMRYVREHYWGDKIWLRDKVDQVSRRIRLAARLSVTLVDDDTLPKHTVTEAEGPADLEHP